MVKKTAVILVLLVTACLVFYGCATTGMGKGGKPKAPKYQCNDRVDNDGDGACDFEGCTVGKGKNKQQLPPDPDCASATDDNEATEGPVCGDGNCEGGEDCSSCEADCGACPPVCGDGTTDPGEECEGGANDDECLNTGPLTTCDLTIQSYGTKDAYGDCFECVCHPDNYTWGPPSDTNYCNNCIHCTDGVQNCGETAIDEGGDCGISDSCEDTDGRAVPTVKGTVSGYLSGEPYSYTDICTDTTWLLEYYCSDDHWNNVNWSCSGNFTSCTDGACV